MIMTTRRIRQYNMVIAPPNDKRNGMLFTNKELKAMPWYERRGLLDDVVLIKVKAYNTDVYYSFGARFAIIVKECLTGKKYFEAVYRLKKC